MDERNESGASVGGSANTGGGDFTGRDNKNTVEGGVVINLPDYERYRQQQHETREEWQRRISVELEREFRKNFSELTDALNKLQYTVALNNDLTNRQVKLLEQQVADTREIARKAETAVMTSLTGMKIVPAKDEPQFPTWLIYLITILLVLLVLLGGFAMVRLTFGGA
jgi:hypothetical protein